MNTDKHGSKTMMKVVLLICVYLCSSVANVSAAEGKQLTVRWFGQSFFQITTSAGTRIVTDPHAMDHFGRPTVEADLVLATHPPPDHVRVDMIANKGNFKVIEGIKTPPPAPEGGP